MPIKLPKPIDNYFTADKQGMKAVVRCFTDSAVVKDEGHTYNGIAAIEQWKTDSTNKYTYTSEPFSLEEKEGAAVVSSQLSGNFPGSPVNLQYIFGLEGDKIASLEITI